MTSSSSYPPESCGRFFEGVVRRNPEVGLGLLRILGERLRVLEERLADMVYREVPARLASAILRLVEGEGVMGARRADGCPRATRTLSWPP